MGSTVNPVAQRLVESFAKLNKLHMRQHNVEGLKPNEFFMLICIKKSVNAGTPGIKVSEISRILKVTAPTVTQIITGLEKQGYVERSMDKEDRRAVRINLTDKGKNFMDIAYKNFMSSFNGLVDYLGEEKSESLVELLKEVIIYFSEVRK